MNPPRLRKRTKTFTGCWTCRARKIKCDEAKPSCRQCYHKGLTCEGYSARLHWLPPSTGKSALHSEDISVGSVTQQPHRRLLPAPPRSSLDYDQVDGILRYLDSLELLVNSRPSDVNVSIQNFGIFGLSEATSQPPAKDLVPVASTCMPDKLPSVDDEYDVTFSPGGDLMGPVPLQHDSGTAAALTLRNSYQPPPPVLDSLDEPGIGAISPHALSVSPNGSSQPLHALGDDVQDSGQEQVPDLGQFSLDEASPGFASKRYRANAAPPRVMEPSIVPYTERLLMHHYRNRVVNLFCVIDNNKSPWKTIHLPRVLQCAGELSFGGTATRILDALRKSLLSISAFYLSNDHRAHHRLEDAERWGTIASQYRCDAIGMLKYAVETDLYANKRPKYKEFLATMLSMVTINVMSGDTSTCGVHLDGAGKLITHMSSLKSTFSRKAQSLHRIYLYLRVIYEGTAIRSPQKGVSRFAASLGSQEACGPQPVPLSRPVYIEEDGTPSSMAYIFTGVAGSPMGVSAHECIYGIPQSLLLLLKESIEVLDELGSLSADAGLPSSVPEALSQRCDQLEQKIMDWPLEERLTRREVAENSINATIIYHQTRAFLNALVIFFSQGVRGMSHRYLRQYVQNILESIEAIEQLKADTKILAAPLFWPAFMGATEAFEPLQQERFRQWYVKVEVYGIEAVRTGIEVVHEVWRLGPANHRYMHSRWRKVVEDRNECLMLT